MVVKHSMDDVVDDSSWRWVVAAADLAPRPDLPQCDLRRPAACGGTGEGMEDLTAALADYGDVSEVFSF